MHIIISSLSYFINERKKNLSTYQISHEEVNIIHGTIYLLIPLHDIIKKNTGILKKKIFT